jgi:hypothetical protein
MERGARADVDDENRTELDDENNFDDDLRAPAPIDAVHRTMLERMDIQERWRNQMNQWRREHDHWRIGIDTRVDKLDSHLGQQDAHAEASFSGIRTSLADMGAKLDQLREERATRNKTKEILAEIGKWAWRVIAAVAFVGWTVGTFFWDHWPIKDHPR